MAGILQMYHVRPDALWGIQNIPYTQRTTFLTALRKTETTCRTQKTPTFPPLLKSQRHNRYINTWLGNDNRRSSLPIAALQQLALMATTQTRHSLEGTDRCAIGKITFLIVIYSYTISPVNLTCVSKVLILLSCTFSSRI